ncbi:MULTISPECIES: SAM-dependent methyltransferase [Treponema]|uniref:Ribosomal RNA large subunit methyltransferase E n=1 Tax=Treponema saccharophilum DSM 2985 TaxID=907348 RepID=H7EH09_9SPIR|nr:MULTISPECIES: RlmE family RNA methyltransferase [Treponema]EIC03127.1 23S rRNA Um-2552 2'-O-methyltransferase [Treponema saccharophilum DSM 2985]MBQ5537257.1 RlmE family RNA methyltransferase [Treponema sp.]BDC96565.1 ribosomal RNA large subunit methyltransferase E [Treponema saccharophilum]
MGNSYEKPDFWSRKAFSEGYPARSVYKLKEIDEKFGMIKKGYTVLDLGAAPGSWTVFLLRTLNSLGEGGKVVSCDLNPLSKSVKAENLVFIQGDLGQNEIVERIKGEGPFDLVVCDAAPLTTGNRVVDTARSQGLVKMAIWYAQTMLRPGGNFAVKIFQNGDQQALLKSMREIFASAKGFKPVACRSESFETYLIGINKK